MRIKIRKNNSKDILEIIILEVFYSYKKFPNELYDQFFTLCSILFFKKLKQFGHAVRLVGSWFPD